jgi:hypothetical protein
MDWTPVIAALGLGLGIVNSFVMVLTYRRSHMTRVEVVVRSAVWTTDMHHHQPGVRDERREYLGPGQAHAGRDDDSPSADW